jgi:hypothetical protein
VLRCAWEGAAAVAVAVAVRTAAAAAAAAVVVVGVLGGGVGVAALRLRVALSLLAVLPGAHELSSRQPLVGVALALVLALLAAPCCLPPTA